MGEMSVKGAPGVRVGRSFAAIAVAALVASLFVGGCSAPPAKQIVLKGTERQSATHYYPESLRLAARARVQARAGDDALAAEYFRGAYHAHPEISYLLAYARASERARFFAESRAAYRDALTHDLPKESRRQVKAEIERLNTLVPKGEVAVTLQVRPRSAHALLERAAGTRAGRKIKPYSRIVMGDAKVFLKPGTYEVHVTANHFQAQLRSFKVSPGEGDSSHGQLVAITLKPDVKVPLALAGGGDVGSKQRPKLATQASAGQADPGKNTGKGPEKTAGKDDDDDDDDEDDEPVKIAGAGGGDDDDDDAGADAQTEESAGSGGGSALHKYGPVATTALGVLGLVGGGALWYLALDEKSLAEAVPASAKNREELFTYHSDRAATFWSGRVIALGVGGALAVAGTIWWAAAPKTTAQGPQRKQDRSLALTLRPSKIQFSGSSLAATWRF